MTGRSLSVACIGAGPAGLLATAELATLRPHWNVTVFERAPRGVSYGYGVVFSDTAIRTIEYLAPSLGELLAGQTRWDDVEVRAHGRRHRMPGHGYTALSRRLLLAELAERAERAGVVLHYETPVTVEQLREDHDLVIAADGASSQTRRTLAHELGAHVRSGRSRYAWLGTKARFDAMTFIFEPTDAGVVVGHGYPHGDGMSTFVAEVPAGTRLADEIDLPDLARVFAEHLNGHGLEGRNPRWALFPVVSLERCVQDNVVLIGDAAHTVHYSVGSGTRLALEDGFHLARALTRHDDLTAALAAYQRRRLPSAGELQTVATRSMRWFENAPRHLALPPGRFSVHLLSRTAHLAVDELHRRAPRLAADACAELSGTAAGTTFEVPLRLGKLRLPGRFVQEAGAELPSDAPRPSLLLRPEAPGTLLGTVPGESRTRLLLIDTRSRPLEAAVRSRADLAAGATTARTAVGFRMRPQEVSEFLECRRDIPCDLIDIAASGTGELMAALDLASELRSADLAVMVSGTGLTAAQSETHMLAGRIDLWCAANPVLAGNVEAR